MGVQAGWWGLMELPPAGRRPLSPEGSFPRRLFDMNQGERRGMAPFGLKGRHNAAPGVPSSDASIPLARPRASGVQHQE